MPRVLEMYTEAGSMCLHKGYPLATKLRPEIIDASCFVKLLSHITSSLVIVFMGELHVEDIVSLHAVAQEKISSKARVNFFIVGKITA